MNKLMTVALIAGGLLLLESPEAAAHNERHNVYLPSAHYLSTHYRAESRRSKHMPYWLKRNRSFRHWYRHTRLRKNRYLAWHELFDIYRWQRSDVRNHRRGDSHGNRYYESYRYDDGHRYNGRDRKRRNRH